jgi:hypothetical protein
MTTHRSRDRRLPTGKLSRITVAIAVWVLGVSPAYGAGHISETAHNLLLDARVSGNIESLDKGLRGATTRGPCTSSAKVASRRGSCLPQ